MLPCVHAILVRNKTNFSTAKLLRKLRRVASRELAESFYMVCDHHDLSQSQRVFGAPFCFSRVSLGKLASFPESESWSGAKSEAKPRKPAKKIPTQGVFQVYPGVSRYSVNTRKIPGILPIGPPTSLRLGSEDRARKNGWKN